MTPAWVGLALAGVMSPVTAGMVAVAVHRWRTRPQARPEAVLLASRYVLLTVAVALFGYASTVAETMAGLALVGFLLPLVLILIRARQAKRAR